MYWATNSSQAHPGPRVCLASADVLKPDRPLPFRVAASLGKTVGDVSAPMNHGGFYSTSYRQLLLSNWISILSSLLRQRSKNCVAQKYNRSGMKNIIGKRVQEARRQFKPPLSQEELAVRLELDGWKISRGTLSKIEAGIRQVTDIELMVLARTLKVAPEWLLDKQLFERLLRNLRR